MTDTDDQAGWIDRGLFRIDPRDVTTSNEFEGLHARAPGLVQKLIRSMRRGGFDPACPVVIWRQRNILVDGHARRLAALRARVELVALVRDFENETEVVQFILDTHRQRSKTSTSKTVSTSKPTRSPQEPAGAARSSKTTSTPTDPPKPLPGQLSLF